MQKIILSIITLSFLQITPSISMAKGSFLDQYRVKPIKQYNRAEIYISDHTAELNYFNLPNTYEGETEFNGNIFFNNNGDFTVGVGVLNTNNKIKSTIIPDDNLLLGVGIDLNYLNIKNQKDVSNISIKAKTGIQFDSEFKQSLYIFGSYSPEILSSDSNKFYSIGAKYEIDIMSNSTILLGYQKTKVSGNTNKVLEDGFKIGINISLD